MGCVPQFSPSAEPQIDTSTDSCLDLVRNIQDAIKRASLARANVHRRAVPVFLEPANPSELDRTPWPCGFSRTFAGEF